MAAGPVLTPEQREHFLNHGWVKIPKAFTKEQAAEVTKDVWTRLGMDPNDKTTWHTIWTNMPSHNTFDAAQFAPKAWAAICELCGGEDRITPGSRQWRDALIVNLGSPEHAGRPDPPGRLFGWHVDGDFFIHYLDSPEQGLLVVPLFTDVAPGGGGTALCPRGMRAVAEHLRDHPEGVSPRMIPRGDPDFGTEKNPGWFNAVARRVADEAAAAAGGVDGNGHGGDDDGLFVEACGDAGDVFLLHPLMLHSKTNNPLRSVRIITNPPVGLRAPFCFDRAGGEYSLVERATLRMLGREEAGGLGGWAITHPREKVVPERVRVQERMKADELRRLEERRKAAAAAV